MQRTVFTFLLSLLLLLPAARAQYESVFPALEGAALLQALQGNYSPDEVLPFSDSRDTLFSRVDARNDSLRCVYTGYTIYLDPTEDPTQDAFAKGINTEHTFPRAFGAGQGAAEADMHNLFPTRENVNADRANLPFREIPDGQTSNWYYLDQQQSGVPGSNIELYSERISTGFEPPEAHKGDVARAMFYFYTIYRTQADAEDPNFFESQRETLCDWHLADPVDETEYQRSEGIAFYQGNPNPFVLDCTVAQRSWCPSQSEPCELVAVEEPGAREELELRVVPNPVREEARLRYRLPIGGEVQLLCFDAAGRKVAHHKLGQQSAGQHAYSLRMEGFYGPFLLCRLLLSNNDGVLSDIEKILFFKAD